MICSKCKTDCSRDSFNEGELERGMRGGKARCRPCMKKICRSSYLKNRGRYFKGRQSGGGANESSMVR